MFFAFLFFSNFAKFNDRYKQIQMRVIPMSCDLIRVIIDDLAVVCMMK